MGVDALAGDYPAISPYCYVEGNPVRMVDPGGKGADVYKVKDENGKVVGVRVVATVYIYGEKADDDLATSLENQINNAWNAGTPKVSWQDKEYNVTFEINVEAVSMETALEKAATNKNNSINFMRIYEADDEIGISGSGIEGNSGKLDLTQNKNNVTTAEHEMGHLLGFRSNDPDDNTHFTFAQNDIYPLMYSGKSGIKAAQQRVRTQEDLNGLNLLKNLFGMSAQKKVIGEPINNKILKSNEDIRSF